MNTYGIPKYLRRTPAPKQSREWIVREIAKFILYSLVGAGIAIALQTHAEQPMSVTVSEESEPPSTIVLAHVTAYTSSTDETDEDPHTTASGTKPERGTLACPSKYDFGTVVTIKGKTYICEDRMNARYRNSERFDMWVPTKSEAYRWGKQKLQVEVKET